MVVDVEREVFSRIIGDNQLRLVVKSVNLFNDTFSVGNEGHTVSVANDGE